MLVALVTTRALLLVALVACQTKEPPSPPPSVVDPTPLPEPREPDLPPITVPGCNVKITIDDRSVDMEWGRGVTGGVTTFEGRGIEQPAYALDGVTRQIERLESGPDCLGLLSALDTMEYGFVLAVAERAHEAGLGAVVIETPEGSRRSIVDATTSVPTKATTIAITARAARLDGRPVSIDQLEARLGAIRVHSNVVVRADRKAPWGQVRRAIEAADAVGFTTIRIARQPAPREPTGLAAPRAPSLRPRGSSP